MKKGWEVKKLGEVFLVQRGGYPRPIKRYLTNSDDGVNWIKISDGELNSKYIYRTKEKIKIEGIKKSRVVEKGDMILSNSMSFGRPYIMKTRGCIHDGWLVLKNRQIIDLDINYIFYLLGSPIIYSEFDRLAAGATVRNLNINLVSSIMIPIPPLQEQERIVKKLDAAFDEIDKAKANIERNITNAEELFQSKLDEVFSQKGEGWEEKRLKTFGTITSSKRIYKKEYAEKGIPFYRSKEIKELAYQRDLSIQLFILEKKYREIEAKFGVPNAGDILITAVGTIGEIYVVRDGDKFYFKDGNVIWLRNFTGINRYYLKYALRCYVKKLNEISKGAAYKALTIEKLKEYKIQTPPLPEQERIVKILDIAFAKLEELKARYNRNLIQSDELKKSILEKAFEGELL